MRSAALLERRPERSLAHPVGRSDERLTAGFREVLVDPGRIPLLLGDGPVRDRIRESTSDRVIAPGYLKDRSELARWLASADIYVSAMADETFGVSVIEAQASGLPVVGVAAGAMLDRVDDETGRLGPVDDAEAMAANILDVWNSDRAAMGRSARAHVEGQFSWEGTFRKLFGEVYPEAVEARRAAIQGRRVGAFAGSPAA